MSQFPNITYKNTKLYTIIKIAIFVSFLCIIGPIMIPLTFSPIPISITNLILYLSIYVLGYKLATYATIIYLLLGIIGLPVFAGYLGGLQVILGPTGGYLLGFIPLTYIIGFFIHKSNTNKLLIIIGYILGNIICYTLGTFWLAYITHTNIKSALFIGVIPYLIGDIIKVFIAVKIFPKLAKRLNKFSI